jgi:hypothetical protein
MQNFTARDLSVLVGSALIAFGLLYWALDVDLAAAVGLTAAYTALAVVIMYFKGRDSSLTETLDARSTRQPRDGSGSTTKRQDGQNHGRRVRA